MNRAPHIALIAGEASGDQLGAKLMQALRDLAPGVSFSGVGGSAMEAQGLKSLFPMSDIAVMGILPVIKMLPTLLKRIRSAAAAVIAAQPDVLVIIDSPDFTHRVARRVRAALPKLPIVDYVSPSVWAWRPGRARAMRSYVDKVLALLPFEPEAHRRLRGPACVYVGHPLIERLADLRPNGQEQARRAAEPPLIVVLPGSRRAEIARLMADFGAALALVQERQGPLEIVLPALAHLEVDIRAAAAHWRVAPKIVLGEAAKLAAFRNARAALAKSGTTTLELALAGAPMVGAYKISRLEEQLKYVVSVTSFLLPNLILGERAIPELMQRDCTPEKLAQALQGVLREGPERQAQLAALRRLDALMQLPGGEAPSRRAAQEVLAMLAGSTAR